MVPKSNFESSREQYDLELFFEHSADLLCIAGFDGYFKKVNPALTKLLGYSKETLYEKPIDDFILPDDREVTNILRNSIKEGIPLLNFENRYITNNGETVWLSWTSIPDKDRKVVYAVAKNMTHNRKLSDDRNLLLSNLTKTNNTLKQLTYSTSHDLRSPLGNIIGILSILDLSTIDDKETLELIDMLKVSAEKMKQTLDKQIDSLRQTEKVIVNVEMIDLDECLSITTKSIQSYLKSSRAKIDASFEAFVTIRFNQAYMESIFLNLITNSIRYAKPNVPPVITIKTEIENGLRKLIFSDNGIGMDMDKVKGKIFGFNQTFHDHKESKGIGLYLVNNHVQTMGSSISLDSEVGKGTTFTIFFSEREQV